MSHKEENKKIIQLLVLKGILPLKKIDEILPQYNEFFDGPLLEWFQNQKFLNGDQITEIRNSLQDVASGNTVQISSENSERQILPTLAAIPSPGTPPTQPSFLSETPVFAQINQLPKTLGSYQILEKIGEGGMGKVFKAKHLFLDKWVAFKVLNERLLQNQKFITRFFREAKSAGTLNHPNIVRCLDAGLIEGVHYLAMEFVEGETISSILRQRKLEIEESLHIILKILEALEHAQNHAMIHRDLKPDNIMISRDGEIKLLDFGLAKTVGDSSLTLDGSILGTPYYMSPEQARGESEVTIAADLYALGATLFHMLTGEVPYSGDSPLRIIRQHLEDPVPSLRAKLPTIDPRLEALIEKLMAKNPKNRYQNPAEVRLTILQILSTPPPSSIISAKESPVWEQNTVYFETPQPNEKTIEWQDPPPTQKFKFPASPQNPPSTSASSFAKTLQQNVNASDFPAPTPSTSKFVLSPKQTPANPPSTKIPVNPPSTKADPSPKNPDSGNPPSTKLAHPPSQQASFSYKISEKTEPQKEEPSLDMEEESFVAPFPIPKKKESQASGFVPGSQMYHGNWKPPSSESLSKPTDFSPLRKKKKRYLFLSGMFFIVCILGAYGWFYPEQLKSYWTLASTSLDKAKSWFTELLNKKNGNETFTIDVTTPDPTTEIDPKQVSPKTKMVEELQQLWQTQPVPHNDIYQKYQTLFKQFPETETTLSAEWTHFLQSYEKIAQNEFQALESLDFIAKNLFLFEESIQRWDTYSNKFAPLPQFNRVGKEQSKYFQDLKLSAEKKIYFLLNKGLEPLWKTRDDFERDWQKTGGDSKSYQISGTSLVVNLDKQAKDLLLIYKKLFPLSYLLSFKANIKVKGFELLTHYENATTFNTKLFSKELYHFSSNGGE
ncbi:MAG: protein kinase, partial [Planctomycetota bacterium]